MKKTPFWWDDVDLAVEQAALPEKADLCVIGGGYTGLSAAIEAARLGMFVVVLEKGEIGAGCSSRNGGQISLGLKPSFEKLSRKHGHDLAERVYDEARNALNYMDQMLPDLPLSVDHYKKGRFLGAHSPKKFKMLADMAEIAAQSGANHIKLVEADQQRSEIASDYYHGGLVDESFSSVHPAKLLKALVMKAQALGVVIVQQCEALSFEKRSLGDRGQSFDINSSQGLIAASKMLVAINGYSGRFFGWSQRRIIPIGTYMLATEILPKEIQQSLIPHHRNVVDTKKVVVYFRMSPDGTRLLFGGRAALSETDPENCLPQLRKMMTDIFPQLSSTQISHNWNGFVGFTFDHMAHIGCHDGIHYAMGYCGSGIAFSCYFGMKIGRQIAGQADGKTAFDDLKFETRPLYSGTPWFLAPSVSYYKFIDKYLS